MQAGQATEPESMIPIGLVAPAEGQVVLAGDPLQLGPVLRSSLAKAYGLEMSFLERMTLTEVYKRNEKGFADHGYYDPLVVSGYQSCACRMPVFICNYHFTTHFIIY